MIRALREYGERVRNVILGGLEGRGASPGGAGHAGDPTGEEEPYAPPDEPIVLPIEESIDLHHFRPGEVIEVLDAYVDAALEAGFHEVRVIHGRGKGVQRARIRRYLAADPRVLRFDEAPPGRGGWGATLAWLDPAHAAGQTTERTESERAPHRGGQDEGAPRVETRPGGRGR